MSDLIVNHLLIDISRACYRVRMGTNIVGSVTYDDGLDCYVFATDSGCGLSVRSLRKVAGLLEEMNSPTFDPTLSQIRSDWEEEYNSER